MDTTPNGYGEVEFPEPVMLAEIVIDCRDPSQWTQFNDGRPVAITSLPPVLPRPDTTGWPVVEAVGSAGEWLGSYDQDGTRLDVPDQDREPGGP